MSLATTKRPTRILILGGGYVAVNATRHMGKPGVELMVSTRVAWATPNEVGLSNGMRIPTRTIVSAVGTKPAPILDELPLPRDERGKVQTDRLLRVPGYDNVWAAGDCAAVPHPKGGTCPPVGIYALMQGTHASRNILRVAAGQEPHPFNYPGPGQAVSIGRRTAVSEAHGIEFTGLLCWHRSLRRPRPMRRRRLRHSRPSARGLFFLSFPVVCAAVCPSQRQTLFTT